MILWISSVSVVMFPFLFQILLIWTFSAINFPLSTAFIASHKFGYAVRSFSLNFRKPFISFFISSLTQWWFS
ncbi:vomeronasal 2 receptor, 34 [Cricetulus griseus]|nr:vomeronasal 2 receptor, 34 [Cricetulus griseus]